MSDFVTHPGRPIGSGSTRSQAAPSGALPPFAIHYGAALAMVAGATLLAFVVKNVIAAPNLTLIYVLPVVVAGAAFGWGPSLVAVIAGVLAFDFFFTEPYFSFTIYSPADIWSAVMLLVVAGIVTTVAAASRRRALEARRAAEQAEALQGLAHMVIEQRPRGEVLDAAAHALHEIFRGPTVIYLQEGHGIRRAADAGRPVITPIDEEAARGALLTQLHTRAETYPYDQAEFEFWPVATPAGQRFVLGVDFTRAEAERPEKPERFTEPVAAYVAAALSGHPGRG
jgi:K+-sensing histidine kinase KdpD